MVETQVRCHSSRHRRTASIRAERAIVSISPIRPADRRVERRRIEMGRHYRARLATLRDMRRFFGLPQPLPPRRVVLLPHAPRIPQVIVLSDTSSEDEGPPDQVPPPVVDLESTLEALPDIDPRPQFQLPVEPLPDFGSPDITVELGPPLHHQALR